jgi:hypothetical protein
MDIAEIAAWDLWPRVGIDVEEKEPEPPPPREDPAPPADKRWPLLVPPEPDEEQWSTGPVKRTRSAPIDVVPVEDRWWVRPKAPKKRCQNKDSDDEDWHE